MAIRIFIIFFIFTAQIPFALAQKPKFVLAKRFPDNTSQIENNYLITPFSMVKYKDHFYVTDKVDNNIKIFSENGKIQKVIAREGRGPGELSQPHEFAIDTQSGLLFCNDRGNNRISCFTTDGDFIKSFRTSQIIVDLNANKGFIYTQQFSESEKMLFTMWDSQGNLLRQFGEKFDKDVNKLNYGSLLYQLGALSINNDSLYMIFNYLPIIQVYDSKGNFVRSIDVKIDFVQENYKHNLDEGKVVDNGRLRIKNWLMGANTDDDYFYCYANKKGEMFILDHSGNLVNKISFKGEKPEGYNQYHFISKENNEFYFAAYFDSEILIYNLEKD